MVHRFRKQLQVSAMLVVVGLAFLATPAVAEVLSAQGEWHSVSSDLLGGTWTATLTRDGSHLQGTLQLNGSNVFTGGDVTGDISASSIVLGIMGDAVQKATFSAQLVGDSLQGEWECDAVHDSGVWYGTLSAVR
jgi:hypothetical protein